MLYNIADSETTLSVTISGVTGINANSVNGIYDRALDEQSLVYCKRGDADMWFEYGGGGQRQWMAKKTADKGTDSGLAFVDVVSVCPPEKIPPLSTWKVYDGSKWIATTGVTVSIAGTKTEKLSQKTPRIND